MAGISRLLRDRGSSHAPDGSDTDGLSAKLFEPAATADATPAPGPSPVHPSDEPTAITPWATRLHQRLRIHFPAVIAAIALMVAAAATLIAPVQTNSCPTTLLALTATSVAAPGGAAPEQATGEVKADDQAISSARGMESDAQSAIDAAESAQTAAGKLQQKADAAQSDADDASISQDSSAVDSAQWDVDSAESTLEWAQSDLEGSESMLASDKAGGWDTRYDNQAVADAKAAVKDAEAALAKEKAALAAAQKAAESAASDAQSRQKTADQLASKARSAQEKADADLDSAQAALTNAQERVSNAEETKSGHRQAAAVKVALWSHQHHIDSFNARAINTTVTDCRRAARKNAGVGAGLLIAAFALLLVDTLSARHRSTADVAASASDADNIAMESDDGD